MALTFADAEGWEWGLSASGNANNSGANSGLSIAGTTWEIVSTKNARAGRQWHGKDNVNGWELRKGGVGGASMITRFYLAVDAYPAAATYMGVYEMRDGPSGTNYVTVRLRNDGKLDVGFFQGAGNPLTGTLLGMQTSSNALSTGIWHRIELYLDLNATTWTLRWQIDGVVQTNATLAGQVATTWQLHCLGHDNSGFRGDGFYDDWAISQTVADYPIGPGSTRLTGPSAAGTHVGVASFQNDGGSAIDGTSLGRIQDYSSFVMGNVGDAFTAVGDGKALEYFGPFSAAKWLEYLIGAYTLQTGETCTAVTAVQNEYARNIPSPFMRIEYFTDLGSLGNRDLTGGSANNQVSDWRWKANTNTQPGAPLPVPAGGWTQTRLNNIKFRFSTEAGGGTDAATKVYGLAYLAVQLHLTLTKEPSQGLNIWQRF